MTVPVGVPGEVEVTVAVNVTDCPVVEGFADDVTAVEVTAGPLLPVMTSLTTMEVEAKNCRPPVYVATIE